jgi:hypothetical protein
MYKTLAKALGERKVQGRTKLEIEEKMDLYNTKSKSPLHEACFF